MKYFVYRSSRAIGLFITRVLKRVFLLVVGVGLTYVIAWELFPALNRNFSVVTTILLTYLASAYLLIPAGIRVLRLWYRPEHIPHFTTTPDGFKCDPINIGIVGTAHQIKVAMKKIGWYQADSKSIRNMLKLVAAILQRKPYYTAPFSSLYLFGRKQDLGFQKQLDDSYFHRHHVRFWASSTAVSKEFSAHVHFWQRKVQMNAKTKLLWVGAAIKDEGFGFIRYHGQITHSVDADTNAERDYIVDALKSAGLVKEVIRVTAGEETTLANRVLGDHMISDGELDICILK